MGRDIKRVPLDFDWPLNQVWEGYVYSDAERERFTEIPCTCSDRMGYASKAYRLYQQWYGNAPFRPEDNGSVPLTAESPAVRAYAERNVSHSPEFYGTGENALRLEAERLATLFNKSWSYHLSQQDIDDLLAADRMREYTHTFVSGEGWVRIEPVPEITVEQVNENQIIGGLFREIRDYHTLIEARAAREGFDTTCRKCGGHGSIEAYEGQRAAAERWEPTEPPEGEGWQVWETVSEGSPISPVFATREGLVQWLMSPEYTWGTSQPLTREQAENFIGDGWAPSVVVSGGEIVTAEGFRG